jgi:hypothetical protein
MRLQILLLCRLRIFLQIAPGLCAYTETYGAIFKEKFKFLALMFDTQKLINYAPRNEDVRGSGGIAPPFLTSALDGNGQLQASTDLTPGK